MDAIMDQIYEDIYRNQIEWLQRELQERDGEKECIRKCDKAVEEGCKILCQGVPDEAECYSECIGNGFRDCLRKCRGRR